MWFRFIGATAKPEEIFVLQYVSEDLQNGWKSRGTQLDVVDSLSAIDNSFMIAAQTPVLRYCLAEQSTRMILIVVERHEGWAKIFVNEDRRSLEAGAP